MIPLTAAPARALARRQVARPGFLRGADELGAADDTQIILFGILPMGIAVLAGLWMGLRG